VSEFSFLTSFNIL